MLERWPWGAGAGSSGDPGQGCHLAEQWASGKLLFGQKEREGSKQIELRPGLHTRCMLTTRQTVGGRATWQREQPGIVASVLERRWPWAGGGAGSSGDPGQGCPPGRAAGHTRVPGSADNSSVISLRVRLWRPVHPQRNEGSGLCWCGQDQQRTLSSALFRDVRGRPNQAPWED